MATAFAAAGFGMGTTNTGLPPLLSFTNIHAGTAENKQYHSYNDQIYHNILLGISYPLLTRKLRDQLTRCHKLRVQWHQPAGYQYYICRP